MKEKKHCKRIIFICTVIISAFVLLCGVSVLYLYLADIKILDKYPTSGEGHTWSDVAEAHSKAQYSGYYEENDDFLNEAFADQPWFGYAYYDVFSASMTIYLKEDTKEHRQTINEYIETVDQGGCTYLFDICSVSFGTFKKDYERIQNIRYLLNVLGMNRAQIVRGELYIELRKGLCAPAVALIHLMTEEKEALVFYLHQPSPSADK